MSDRDVIKVWDIAVRIFHWSLVIVFSVSYMTADSESIVHIYSGYGVLALVIFRVLWGIVGTKHARFTDFVYGKAAVSGYLKGLLRGAPPHYLGHNPPGGWMVIVLLVSLAAVCWSGLETYADDGLGPLADADVRLIRIVAADEADEADEDDDREHDSHSDTDEENELWEEMHEVLANLTLFLVFIHVAGVLLSSWIHKENLIRAMLTGYKDSLLQGPARKYRW